MKYSPLAKITLVFWLAIGSLLVAGPLKAESIIKRPGDHQSYAFELDPHLLAQYSRLPYGGEGFGLGLRFSIPFVHNGPVPKINNNIGISFGMDFATFGDDGRCHGYGNPDFFTDHCGATTLWFPVTGQWNFFLTPVISVFGEFGLAARYSRWWYEGPCNNGGDCSYSAHQTDFFEPVFWGGGRFLFGKTAGLTVRLGWPYISVGASILF
jgi:hypothetical protein